MRGGFDSEYASLMAELGEGAAGGVEGGKSWGGTGMGHDITAGGSNIPPWRRPENWQQPAATQQQQGYRPPQNYGAGYPGAGANAWAGYQQDYSSYAAYYQGQYAQQQHS